jgi:hypothetical protein
MNYNKSDSRIINLQNQQTNDFSKSRLITVFIFTNPIIL